MNVFGKPLTAVGLFLVSASLLMASSGFDPLFQLSSVSGTCLVRLPGVPEYEVAVEGRAYPYGSRVRTQADATVIVFLSRTVQIRLGNSTAVTVAHCSTQGPAAKVVTLESGFLGIFTPNDEAELLLQVVTPAAEIDNFKGRSEIRLYQDGEEHRLAVATAIGDVRLNGPQFSVERMRRSARLEIVTALDESYTSLTGRSGEFEMLIERGAEDPSIVEFRSGAHVKIWRRWSALSNRLAVSVMVAGSGGGVKESFAYLQGASEILDAVVPVATGLDLGDAVPPGADLFGSDFMTPPAGGADDAPSPAAEPATTNENFWEF